MKTVIYFIVFLFVLVSAPACRAVEFETSTGQEDVVLMSTDGEVNLGDSLAKSVEKQFKVVKDAEAQTRVDGIGQKIAAVCDRKDIIYHFKVIDLKERDKDPDRPMINAFSLPGGYVYVFKDLYDKMNDTDELAAVIAHEVGHIVARHGVKRMQSSYGATALMILATATSRNTGGQVGQAFEAISTLMMAYGREDELFADKMSVKYTRKAGYNPEGAVKVLQKLWDLEKKEPLHRYVDDKDHPYLSIRISKAKEEVNGKMDFKDYINMPEDSGR